MEDDKQHEVEKVPNIEVEIEPPEVKVEIKEEKIEESEDGEFDYRRYVDLEEKIY
jgi:hypothetical protein